MNFNLVEYNFENIFLEEIALKGVVIWQTTQKICNLEISDLVRMNTEKIMFLVSIEHFLSNIRGPRY